VAQVFEQKQQTPKSPFVQIIDEGACPNQGRMWMKTISLSQSDPLALITICLQVEDPLFIKKSSWHEKIKFIFHIYIIFN
jgi:hypothetical protein